MRQKLVVCSLVSNFFDSPQLWHTIKTNCIKLLAYAKTFSLAYTRDMLKFDFLENILGIVSLPHFVYDFSRKNVSHVIFY